MILVGPFQHKIFLLFYKTQQRNSPGSTTKHLKFTQPSGIFIPLQFLTSQMSVHVPLIPRAHDFWQ